MAESNKNVPEGPILHGHVLEKVFKYLPNTSNNYFFVCNEWLRQAVPSFVVTDGGSFKKVSGNISLQTALEILEKKD